MTGAKLLSIISIRTICLARAFIDSPCLRNVLRIRSFWNSAVIDQPAQRSHRVGATTKPKQKDLVATGVVLNDVAVSVYDVLMNATAGSAGAHFAVVGA